NLGLEGMMLIGAVTGFAVTLNTSPDLAEPGRPIGETRAGFEGNGESGHRADQHHALEPKIEHAALLNHEFAGRGEQDRRRHADHGDERVDEEADIHATASAGVARGASRRIRTRYRTRMSLARMKN